MKDLVRDKALSRSRADNTIDLNDLVQQFGLGSERELLPAEPRFETVAAAVPRAQEEVIAQQIVTARWPVIIQAGGGLGKSILCQRLPAHLPTGSEAVLFDGFAGGDYRNPRLHRHKHSRGLVQIANELARRGMCDVLVPQPAASEQNYLEAFRNRLEQAVAVVRSRALDAILLIVIDAADNLGIAADEVQERSFVPDLLKDEPPEGCRVVAVARTHRVVQYLRPPDSVPSITLDPFNLSESTLHLRTKFPEASAEEAKTFHRFTDRNPRVQANALAIAKDLKALLDALGPQVVTFEQLIDAQISIAFEKVVKEHASSPSEVEPLGVALAALVPPIPIWILAEAALLPVEAVQSFICDFGNGRFIVVTDHSVQFHDEPVETWFHQKFLPTTGSSGRIADLLGPLASTDGYVAAALPVLLFRAERYGDLLRLALEGAEPTTQDPVERRNIVLGRVRYALKFALTRGGQSDAVKLLMRAGEEVAANQRQSGFLMEQADLVASLAGPNVVSDFIFRQRPWAVSGKAYAYCAAMLAADGRNTFEAARFIELAEGWLKRWRDERRQRASNVPWMDRSDIEIADLATYAEAIYRCHGAAAAVAFMRHWRDWAAFEATQALAVRLIDRGEKPALEALLQAAGDRTAMRLAIILEMGAVALVPSAQQVSLTLALLIADQQVIDPDNYPDKSAVLLSIVATAEAAVPCGLPKAKILALLDRYPCPHPRVYRFYDHGERRQTILRAAALRAALIHRDLTLEDVRPASLSVSSKESRAGTDQEEREFKLIYSALVPWYRLRALGLAGRAQPWGDEVARAQKECRSERWSWGGAPELDMVINEIGKTWFDAVLWSGRSDVAAVTEIEKWLVEQDVHITIATWTRLARRASIHTHSFGANALRFAHRARTSIEDEYADAKRTADSFASLARAVLPLGREEASGYFQKALAHLSRLGDELHERLFAILALAERSAVSGRADPTGAYRVARVGELFHAYNDHKFPWASVIEAVTRLCPSSGLAIASRWNDRYKVALGRVLPWVTLCLLETGAISPRVGAALHAFGGYWRLHKNAHLFLDSETVTIQKQAILDMLAHDQEFDPDNEDDAIDALLTAATRHGLERQRLQSLADLSAKQVTRDHVDEGLWATESETTPPQPIDWAELFADLDLYTPEGIDAAIARWRSMQTPPLQWEELFGRLRQAIGPSRRAEHVRALARSTDLMVAPVFEALEGCANEWTPSMALESSLADAINHVVTTRSEEIVARSWAFDTSMQLCARLSHSRVEDVLQRLMQASAESVERASATRLFELASAYARNALTADQAKDALSYGLDRLEPILNDKDGDGPWRSRLMPPPEISRAIARLCYAMLASPVAKERWRAAHATRRLCRLGETEVVAGLIELLPAAELPAFTDNNLPFYALHARLYLLIVFARVAAEAPEFLVAHALQFVYWALESGPHVLVREFAARVALELSRQHSGLLDQNTIDRLTVVSTGPFAPQPAKPTEVQTGGALAARSARQFTLDYDFDQYWLTPLARAFNVTHQHVADSIEKWVVERWGQAGMSAWDKDPRARRWHYFMDTSHSHGSYPRVDRYSFYLSYHAMFCTAGELLAEFPPVVERGENQFREWLSDHELTRPDGHWLADRRDVAPLERRRWQQQPQPWERGGEWRFCVPPPILIRPLVSSRI